MATKREDLARIIAQEITGNDPDTLALPPGIEPMRLKGNMISIPIGWQQPIWTYFLPVAGKVLDYLGE